MLIQWPIYNQTGGAERIACEFANELIHQGHEVTILSGDKESGRPFYSLDEQVKLIHFGDIPIHWFQRKILRSIFTWSSNIKVKKFLKRLILLDFKAYQLREKIDI